MINALPKHDNYHFQLYISLRTKWASAAEYKLIMKKPYKATPPSI